jgi:hypothetical protein
MENKRFKEPLINPTEEEMFTREPLMAFSFYLSGRNNVLLSLSDEIIDNLDKGLAGPIIKGDFVDRASTLLWLWTLGAYEVIRTISQATESFSDPFIGTVNDLKKRLAIVRMPNAKMEEQGKKEPVNSNRSPDGWDVPNKDLLVGSPENPISGRLLLSIYQRTISALTLKDVKKHHQESYKPKPNNNG